MAQQSNSGAVPVAVGDLTSLTRELLREEGIFSEGASNYLVVNRDARERGGLNRNADGERQLTLVGLDAISNFEAMLQELQENKPFGSFFDLLWGTSQGTGSTALLKEKLDDAVEISDVPAAGAVGSLGLSRSVSVDGSGGDDEGVVEGSPENLIRIMMGREDEMKDALVANFPSNEDEEPAINDLNYIVFNTNGFDSGTRNADLMAVWLRGIPSTDFSRAIPWVRISLLQSSESEGFADDFDQDALGKNPRLSWEFSLEGRDASGQRVSWSKSEEFAERFASSRRTPLSGGSTDSEERGTALQSHPDVMLAPQTFVPFRSRGDVLDPMVPQLGLLNLSISTASTGHGMIAVRSANLTLKLFDRSRMRDIAPIISPTFRSSVGFVIEWGWRCALPDHMHTHYTRLLDKMRVREYFGLTRSSFSFNDDGSVNLDLSLHNQPLRDFSNLSMSLGTLALEENSEIRELFESTRSIATELVNLLSDSRPQENVDVNVTSSNFLRRFRAPEDILNIEDGDPIIREIRDFIDTYGSSGTDGESFASRGLRVLTGSSATQDSSRSGGNARLARIVELLRQLFGEYTDQERQAIKARSGSSGSSSTRSRIQMGDRSVPNIPLPEGATPIFREDLKESEAYITDTTPLRDALIASGLENWATVGRVRSLISHHNRRWIYDEGNPQHILHPSISPYNIIEAVRFANQLEEILREANTGNDPRISVTSGLRVYDYNMRILNNNTPRSAHTSFTALDLRARSVDQDVFRSAFVELVRRWRSEGKIVGAGIYNNFCHVDVRNGNVGRTSNANFGNEALRNRYRLVT